MNRFNPSAGFQETDPAMESSRSEGQVVPTRLQPLQRRQGRRMGSLFLHGLNRSTGQPALDIVDSQAYMGPLRQLVPYHTVPAE